MSHGAEPARQCSEDTTLVVQAEISIELVASFTERRRFSHWPCCRRQHHTRSGTVRKMRGTPQQSVGRSVGDRRMFYPRASEVCWPRKQAFSPHTSRGSGAWQNSQPVPCLPQSSTDRRASLLFTPCRPQERAAGVSGNLRAHSRNDARMPHCLRWGGMASLLGGLRDRFPQHNRDLPSKAPPLAAGIFTSTDIP